MFEHSFVFSQNVWLLKFDVRPSPNNNILYTDIVYTILYTDVVYTIPYTDVVYTILYTDVVCIVLYTDVVYMYIIHGAKGGIDNNVPTQF